MNVGKNQIICVVTAVFVLAMAPMAVARIIFVDDDGPADFDNIQAAIDDSDDGDVIIIADGTYTGYGNRDIDFNGKPITVCSENGPETCIIDCEGTETEPHRGFYFNSGEDESSAVKGFTISNGFHWVGGGICCYGSSPTITNNIIKGNRTYYDGNGGAGIACFYGASPAIMNNIITENNSADTSGGGIYCYEAGSPTIANNKITGNCGLDGGGVVCVLSVSPLIMNNIIVGNMGQYWGGGICCWGFAAIMNNIIAGNTAKYGGGIRCANSSATITNNTIVGNMAGAEGGGIWCGKGSSPTMTNCILWGNAAPKGPQAALRSYLYYGPSALTVNYSDLEGGQAHVYIEEGCTLNWDEGNIDTDPLLRDPDGDDDIPGTEDDNLRLSTGSPCIDAGDPNYIEEPNETDLDGKPRVIGGRIDMGAYEYQPRVIYVDDDASGNNDGSSWADAYNYLQDALAAANDSDEIRVAQGTYKPDQGAGITPGDRGATFRIINGVSIKGGYAGFGEPEPDARDIDFYVTVLSGDLNGNDGPNFAGNVENSSHVVVASGCDETAVLDGFTITAGNANPLGGGMYSLHGRPTVINCTFYRNYALSGGGLAYGSPTLINCTFSENAAESSGGGIDNHQDPTLLNCTFIENSANNGGGMYSSNGSPTLINCIFIGNSATGTYYYNGGGGMYNNDMGILTLIDCTFIGNYAFSLGGGMFNWECTSPTLTNCMFSGNTAYYGDGGGICNRDNSSPTLTNCTLSGNLAGSNGGGMDNEGSSNPTLANCILWSNIDSGGMDESAQIHTEYGIPIVNYSCIQGWSGSLGGTGNIGDVPLFVDADGADNFAGTEDDDLRLSTASPCIDAGDPSYIADPNETDLDGRPRVIGGRIDIGAYEAPIPAEARIIPRTINLASKGNWLTCYIWLPEQYNVADIDPNSVFLEQHIKSEQLSVDEQKQVAIARFNREGLRGIINTGEVELTITGQLTGGSVFEGTDVIIVIDKGSRN